MAASTTRTNPNNTHNYNTKLALKTSHLIKTGDSLHHPYLEYHSS